MFDLHRTGRLGDDNGGIINAPGADEIECTADNAKPISPPDGDSDMNSHRSTTIEAVENHASPSNEGNDQMHRVRVYIDDMRCKDNIIRTATTLALSTSDRDECDADEWRTNTRDLLRRLQRTAAALNVDSMCIASCLVRCGARTVSRSHEWRVIWGSGYILLVNS
ncbi:hypothetical protein BJ138DRAFT_1107986 [Hygrophoropsis aurantiaca]|uniref:Uncharacterized protein n=1 Tax=Hygrophoropsis aurantiaca TaxID=72124 RepID=A0ACB7ZQA1_9AGAM|nr:hypothetical protein BJ138DRAFT_1107986 [Hygrophoropsis aurantiaca]